MSTVLVPIKDMGFSGGLTDITRIISDSFVYFLSKDGEIVYVGQSKSVGGRLRSHRGTKEFDKVFAISVPAKRLNEVEGALIRLLNPKLNGAGKFPERTGDVEIAREFGLFAHDKSLHKIGDDPPEHYGLVLCVDGEHEGKIGVYDDDEWECICGDWYFENGIEKGDLTDEAQEKICKSSGCGEVGIVYFGKWTDGWHYVDLDDMRQLTEPSEAMIEKQMEELIPGYAESARELMDKMFEQKGEAT